MSFFDKLTGENNNNKRHFQNFSFCGSKSLNNSEQLLEPGMKEYKGERRGLLILLIRMVICGQKLQTKLNA